MTLNGYDPRLVARNRNRHPLEPAVCEREGCGHYRQAHQDIRGIHCPPCSEDCCEALERCAGVDCLCTGYVRVPLW